MSAARKYREDVRPQAERLDVAQGALKAALLDLADVAKREGRKGHPEIERVLAQVQEVKRAEESRDLAHLDLETARGEDA